MGLLYVATHLKNAGYDIRIKDAVAEGMDWGVYAKYIEGEKPDIYGFLKMRQSFSVIFFSHE